MWIRLNLTALGHFIQIPVAPYILLTATNRMLLTRKSVFLSSLPLSLVPCLLVHSGKNRNSSCLKFPFSNPLCMCAQSVSLSDSYNPLDCSRPGSSVHGISQARYWSGLPFLSPGDLPDPGIFFFFFFFLTQGLNPCLLHREVPQSLIDYMLKKNLQMKYMLHRR